MTEHEDLEPDPEQVNELYRQFGEVLRKAPTNERTLVAAANMLLISALSEVACADCRRRLTEGIASSLFPEVEDMVKHYGGDSRSGHIH
jgi:hypothetical protein